MPDEPPIGERYSQVYEPRGEAAPDSKVWRHRLGAFLDQRLGDSARFELSKLVDLELGIDMPAVGIGYRSFPRLLDDSDIRLVRDLITVIWRGLSRLRHVVLRDEWLTFVRRATHEENVGYRIDDQAGVHPVVDVAFEVERVAIIKALAGARHIGTLGEYEAAHAALEADPPRPKLAIRHVFDAVENLFKLTTGAARLGRPEVTKHLLPIVENNVYPEPPAKHAANKMVASFGAWAEAAHFYRHAAGEPEPIEPPAEFAVMMMATGGGFLRWLAEIDRRNNPPALSASARQRPGR